MEQNSFINARIVQARANLNKMLSILERGDETGFGTIVEEEALTLHAMMMVSRPGYLLLKPNSIEAIAKITQFRDETRLPVCYSLDAGANVHLLYPARIKPQVMSFIASDLSAICEAGLVIHDEVGNGPVRLI
jgi:diphosphomevalonate decarboxylase